MQAAAPQTPVHILRNFLGDDLVNISEDARKLPKRSPERIE
jgi:hypothetical protein